MKDDWKLLVNSDYPQVERVVLTIDTVGEFHLAYWDQDRESWKRSDMRKIVPDIVGWQPLEGPMALEFWTDLRRKEPAYGILCVTCWPFMQNQTLAVWDDAQFVSLDGKRLFDHLDACLWRPLSREEIGAGALNVQEEL